MRPTLSAGSCVGTQVVERWLRACHLSPPPDGPDERSQVPLSSARQAVQSDVGRQARPPRPTVANACVADRRRPFGCRPLQIRRPLGRPHVQTARFSRHLFFSRDRHPRGSMDASQGRPAPQPMMQWMKMHRRENTTARLCSAESFRQLSLVVHDYPTTGTPKSPSRAPAVLPA